MQNIYTVVLKRSKDHWVALCLDNGLTAQGATQEEAIKQLEAEIDTLQENYKSQDQSLPVPDFRQELFKFLVVGRKFPTSEVFELRLICR
jgi:predicted RNase H-like HicB family nuclease